MTATLNTRLVTFVNWVRPDPAAFEDARKQRDLVTGRIKARAEADGLIVRSTPNSGSFAKATSLRRHMLGGAEHEGHDIDCAFVVSRKDEDGDALTSLLGRFERYANESYPDTPREPTKSSIRLMFVASKRNFDLVPLLAVEGNSEEQILLRANGERRRTSIQKHVEFMCARTKKSQAIPGSVAFNECVRLVKWWREYQASESTLLPEVQTLLLDLLCAKAFDDISVQPTYAETLQTWFDKIHSYAHHRANIVFRDFPMPHPDNVDAKWKVIDPVNSENNVVPTSWSGIHIDEFRDWARGARDKVQQAIAYDIRGRDTDAVALMAEVFGPSFTNHSEA